ncbi:MAG: PAS domain-containing protein, partial [Fibrobacterota bacterium]
SSKDRLVNLTQEILLDRFAPAAVVIDSRFEILYHNGATNRYLHPRGPASHNLLDQLPRELDPRIRSAVRRTSEMKQDIPLRVSLAVNGRKTQVTLTFSPLDIEKDLFLLMFSERRRGKAEPEPAGIEKATVRMLENELRATREENLRNTEQLRSLNEELKSSNEELQASNEEMETSREELQSLNEELVTLNNQLQDKIAEVEAVNSDLNNLMSSTNVPTLFLDRQFRVRRFTPALDRIMRLIPADAGRLVSDLAVERLGDEVMDDARKVLSDLVTVKREVRVDDGWFVRLVQPYRTDDNHIDGVVITFGDVTDLKRAEEEIRRSGEKFRIVADFTYDWEYWRGVDGRFVYITPSCERVTGYTREEFMEDPGLYESIIHPEDREWMGKHLVEDLNESGTHEFEFRIVRRDGEVRWISHACRPVTGDKGELLGRRTTNRDITERKTAQQDQERMLKQIAENENRLRLVLENSRDGIHMTDLKTKHYVFMSPAQERLTGFSMEELNMSLDEAAKRLHPDDVDAANDYLARVMAGEEPQQPMEYRWRVKSGEYHWFADSRKLVRDEQGEAVALIGVSRDITEKKRIENALRDSEAQFRQLADSMPQLVWMTRPDGYHEYFNRRWYDFTGTVEGETAGEMWARLLHPDDYQRTLEIWHHSLETGEPYSIEYRFRRASDGMYRWFIGRALPVRNSQGEITRWFGTCTEIHDLKEVEEALRLTTERYNLVNRATNDIIWDWDLVTDHFDWNEAVEAAVGRKRNDMPSGVQSWYDHIHPGEVDRVAKGIHKAIDEGETEWSDEYRFGPVGGPYRVYLDRGIIARDENGKAYRMIGSMLDLTERREAENKISESEQRLRLATEAAQFGVFEWDVNRDEPIWENKRMFEIFGLTPDQKPITEKELVTDFLHPEDLPAFEAAMKEGMQSGSLFRIECRIKRPGDGQWRWIQYYAKFDLGEERQVIRLLGIVADITDRKRIEEKLRLSEERFRTLADNMSQLAWMADPSGWIFWYNKRWYDYTGVTPEEMLDVGWRKVLHPDNTDRVLNSIQHSWDTGEPWENTFPLRGR